MPNGDEYMLPGKRLKSKTGAFEKGEFSPVLSLEQRYWTPYALPLIRWWNLWFLKYSAGDKTRAEWCAQRITRAIRWTYLVIKSCFLGRKNTLHARRKSRLHGVWQLMVVLLASFGFFVLTGWFRLFVWIGGAISRKRYSITEDNAAEDAAPTLVDLPRVPEQTREQTLVVRQRKPAEPAVESLEEIERKIQGLREEMSGHEKKLQECAVLLESMKEVRAKLMFQNDADTDSYYVPLPQIGLSDVWGLLGTRSRRIKILAVGGGTAFVLYLFIFTRIPSGIYKAVPHIASNAYNSVFGKDKPEHSPEAIPPAQKPPAPATAESSPGTPSKASLKKAKPPAAKPVEQTAALAKVADRDKASPGQGRRQNRQANTAYDAQVAETIYQAMRSMPLSTKVQQVEPPKILDSAAKQEQAGCRIKAGIKICD